MVHPHLLALTGGLALLVPLAELWSRYWGADPENWPRRALIRASAACLLLALLGFDESFGLIPDPGIREGLAWKTELSLHLLTLVGLLSSLWLWRRD